MRITDYSILTSSGNLDETLNDILLDRDNFTETDEFKEYNVHKVGKVDVDVSAYPSSRYSRSAQLALKAMETIDTDMLLRRYAPEEIMVIVGTGVGGMDESEGAAERTLQGKKPSPTFIPKALGNSIAYHICQRYGFKGGSYSIGSACASSAHALALAVKELEYSFHPIECVIVVGVEGSLGRLGIGGFTALRALATGPDASSIPFDERRSGFIMSEGAGVIVLEGTKAWDDGLAKIRGINMNTDTAEITQGTLDAYTDAIDFHWRDDLGLDIFIKAHATSTPKGDELEAEAINLVYDKERVTIFAPKKHIGHTLGASGVIETILSLEYVQRINHKSKYVISNSFGFGGTNISLLIERGD
jgi:3-oxoacyl-[acyl-carrier-protein] synthase II